MGVATAHESWAGAFGAAAATRILDWLALASARKVKIVVDGHELDGKVRMYGSNDAVHGCGRDRESRQQECIQIGTARERRLQHGLRTPVIAWLRIGVGAEDVGIILPSQTRPRASCGQSSV